MFFFIDSLAWKLKPSFDVGLFSYSNKKSEADENHVVDSMILSWILYESKRRRRTRRVSLKMYGKLVKETKKKIFRLTTDKETPKKFIKHWMKMLTTHFASIWEEHTDEIKKKEEIT